MEKKSVEQQNKEFMENPNISEEDKKETLKIWNRMLEEDKYTMEELQEMYGVLDNDWD